MQCFKLRVTRIDIEAYCALQFAKINGAQKHRALIELLHVVTATHEALVVHAVADAEKVAQFVR